MPGGKYWQPTAGWMTYSRNSAHSRLMELPLVTNRTYGNVVSLIRSKYVEQLA